MQRIAVISHRGGSGKTAVVSGLAAAFSAAGRSTIQVDLCRAGGCSILSSHGFQLTHADGEIQDVLPNNFAVRFPLSDMDGLDALLQENSDSLDVALHDVPATGRRELSRLLRDMDLVVLCIPCEANSLKSLQPFLEFINEERSRPGRNFNVTGLLTRVRTKGLVDRVVLAEAKRYLAPFLAGEMMLEDPSIREAMASGLALGSANISEATSTRLERIRATMESLLESETSKDVA